MPDAEKDVPRVRIDFAVADEAGHELAWGGTSYHSTLKGLADELQAMVERGEFPHGDSVFPPAENDVDECGKPRRYFPQQTCYLPRGHVGDHEDATHLWKNDGGAR